LIAKLTTLNNFHQQNYSNKNMSKIFISFPSLLFKYQPSQTHKCMHSIGVKAILSLFYLILLFENSNNLS